MSSDEPNPESARTGHDRPEWVAWPDEKLLDLRLSELGVTIQASSLEERIQEVYRELEAQGLNFRPHFWLSDEWFTPDGVSGVAIPFYLAHPRLMRLELNQMLEVEGGTAEWCLQILRHEVGHAIDNAFDLRRKRTRQRLFGPSSTPYPEYYTPKPYSKSFVLHLDTWYAQSHPDEDFAETFAVWLTQGSEWRDRYRGWPALKKLQYMDELMRSLVGKASNDATHREVDPLPRLRKTLRQHYRRKRKHYGLEHPDFYDRDLRRIFSDAPEFRQNMPASQFVARIRKDVRRDVARWTGEYQYTIDRVLADIIERCRQLRLRLAAPPDQAKADFTVLLTVQVMNYLHSGRHRVAL
jgi:hypothetical protein